ncbi:hypothetical protein [Desulfocurvus sp. DL9XJH121]
MHPGRRNILIRWIGYAVVIVATAAWIYMDEPQAPVRKADVMQRLAPKIVDLPSDEVTEAIRSAVDVTKRKVATFGEVEKVDPALIVLDQEALKDEPGRVMLSVSTIFLGPPDKYAVLGGRIYKEGDQVPDGRTVQGIDADGVTLAMGDTVDRMPWVPPFRVEITSVMQDTRPRDDGKEQGAASGAEGEQAQGADLQNLPPDLSPDQALEILQKVGNK